MMERYILNISFKRKPLERGQNIVEPFKTLVEAKQMYSGLTDETVDRALIKDKVTDKVTWLKE